MTKKFFFLTVLLLSACTVLFTACGDDDSENDNSTEQTDPDTGSSNGDDTGGNNQSDGTTFKGPQRVFGQNRLKAFGRVDYDRYELTYDDRGFVTKVRRTKDYEDKVYETTYSYEGNTVTMTQYKNGSLRGTGVGTIGSNGYLESGVGPENEPLTFTYNNDEQLVSISVKEKNETETLTFNWQGGNIILSAWNGGQATSITYSSLANVGCVMEYDDGMNIDMDDWNLFYYLGLIGKGTSLLPSEWAYRGSSYTEQGTNEWVLDNQGRAVKLISTQAENGGRSETKEFFWEW